MRDDRKRVRPTNSSASQPARQPANQLIEQQTKRASKQGSKQTSKPASQQDSEQATRHIVLSTNQCDMTDFNVDWVSRSRVARACRNTQAQIACYDRCRCNVAQSIRSRPWQQRHRLQPRCSSRAKALFCRANHPVRRDILSLSMKLTVPTAGR